MERSIVEKFTKNNNIYVYIDDLDRGWSGKKSDIMRISALLNSLRDICGDFRGVQFRIGLRSDVYHLVRTSDESTDKISQHLIQLSWTNHDILVCMAKRIATYCGDPVNDAELASKPQIEIARIFHKVIDPVFNYKGKWEQAPIHRVLLSLTRRRPRDLVKLFSDSAKAAHEKRHEIISSEDLRSIFINYSQDRLQDIINEFKSEMPNVKTLLLGMRPTSVYRFGDHPFLYSNDELTTKLKNIISSSGLNFSNGEFVDHHSLKQFLYKTGFLLARKETDGWVEWVYFDENRFAASREADFGYSWEVHPAYRWALEKRGIQDIIDGTDLVLN
ncbi:P-loop ATPase, Sll1717 family [Caulobacter segnis]